MDFAEELLADPERCREQLFFASCAYRSGPVPASDGDFPAWEFTTDVLPADSSAAATKSDSKEGARESTEPPTLRVVGRVRPARRDRTAEAGYSSVAEVAFRGSRNKGNWITNFAADLTPLSFAGESPTAGVEVHRGWLEAYRSLREVMLGMIADGLSNLGCSTSLPVLTMVTGHSLGAALATLAAYDVAVFVGYDVHCVTWASPRVGNKAFVDAYKAVVKKTARFLTRLDIVPRLPVNPADEHDDGAVLGILRSVLATVKSSAPGRMLGMDGYRHVCKGTVLDVGSSPEEVIEQANTAQETEGMSHMDHPLRVARTSSKVLLNAAGDLLSGLRAGATGVVTGSMPPLPSYLEAHKIGKYSEYLDMRCQTETARESFEMLFDDLDPRDAQEEEARALQEALQRSLEDFAAAQSVRLCPARPPPRPESGASCGGGGIVLGPR